MDHHLTAAVTGPVCGFGGGEAVAANRRARDGRAGSCRSGRGKDRGMDRGRAVRRGAVRSLSTRNLFDCAGTRSRVAFPRNRRKESGGSGDSMQVTAWRVTIEKPLANAALGQALARDGIRYQSKAMTIPRRSARAACRARGQLALHAM